MEWIESGAPAFIGKGKIGDDEIKHFDRIAIFELGIGQRVSLCDQRRGIVVQDHVHPRQAAGRCVLFLPIQRDRRAGFVRHFQ